MPNSLPLPPLDPRQRYTVTEALAYLRTSRGPFYQKIAAGKIATIKDGRRTYVPGSEIARLSSVTTSRRVEPEAA